VENAQSSGNWQDSDHIIRKIDYDNLELSLFRKYVSDYHDLLEHVNIWAVNLGFLVKLKRPPKFNQDGSKTLRVYCATFKKSKPLPAGLFSLNGSTVKQDEETQKQASESNAPRCCNFALTFKSEPNTDCWLLYQEYGKDQMMH